MDIEGSVALVTGANRGLGSHLARELLDRGAAKVYAGVRDPASVTDPDLVPVALDVTDPSALDAAAQACGDVTIVVNNAGIATGTSPLSGDTLDDARREIEVNYLGPLGVARAFAPVLGANGGGAIVNVLSVLSWISLPASGNYAAAKAAAWSMTNSLRTMLRGQGTLVVGVHVGYLDTDMTARLEVPKLAPAGVARQVVDGIAEGREEVLADDLSRTVKAALADDQRLLYPDVQRQYDALVGTASSAGGR
jgi:NAD(P)-dependent dehydrogenase (short-subunit alcohol dehydrogenase family)